MALVCYVWHLHFDCGNLALHFGVHEIMFYFVLAFLVWLFATGKAKDWGMLVYKSKTTSEPTEYNRRGEETDW